MTLSRALTSLRLPALLALSAFLSAARANEYALDAFRDALSFTAPNRQVQAQLGVTLDLEVYTYPAPTPGLLYAPDAPFINPRLTLDLDAQLGRHLYSFAQARADRGFDPGDNGKHFRLDEYALRYTPRANAAFNFQVGKFATVIGNWIARHRSWENPFVTAPLPYENLTGLWNIKPAPETQTLLKWAHIDPALFIGDETTEKPNRTPLLWGPVYATGASVFGRLGKFDYAAELKNVGPSAHPDTWAPHTGNPWRHPALAARLGWRPDARWNLGVSAATGPYLEPSAAPLLPPGRNLGDYRQLLLASDLSFAWRHFQLWAELYAVRFEIPGVADADTLSAYLEIRYKISPRLAAALRLNQQLYATLPDAQNRPRRWGRDTWRIDAAPTFRPTPHTQIKLQYSLQNEADSPRPYTHSAALQFTLHL